MQREAPSSASRRAVVISPSSRMADELEALLPAHLSGVPVGHIRSYPAPRDLAGAMGGSIPFVVFLDVVTDRESALQLLAEMNRLGAGVNVIALMHGNEPDFILRCLRAGAVDFLIQPFTGDQIEAAMAKLARLQPAT